MGVQIYAPPPENVLLIAPMMADVWVVLKKLRKFFDSMTSVMTPESYPKRNDPVAAKTAREMENSRPIAIDGVHGYIYLGYQLA